MAADEYKSMKEAFVSGMTGSSILHINMISAVALSSIALHSAVQTRFRIPKSTQFPVEMLILILPLLLSMTLFANRPGLLSFSILIPTGVLILFPPRESGTPIPSNQPSLHENNAIPAKLPRLHSIAPFPALTTYRAHMLLMTILSILAVDFPVFPRSLVKCETFGVSLMDLGVGSFVFSQGIVSSIPLLKDPSYLTVPIRSKFQSVLRKSLPVIILGLLRVVLVKGVEYPEHESEYGTHWNFFITLALLPVIQVLLHPIIRHLPISMLGVLVALMQQIALSIFGMKNFVLTAPRTNVITANKEGIVSLTGYLAIHLLGLSTGTLILPSSPSYFRRQQRAVTQHQNSDVGGGSDNWKMSPSIPRQNDKIAIELVSYTAIWWSLVGLTRMLDVGAGFSRRMVNLPYIFWVAAFNTTFILGYLLLDMYFFPTPVSRTKEPPSSETTVSETNFSYSPSPYPSGLLEAVNKNGLVLFLAANVSTGLVNMSIPTMYTSDALAILVLFCYACGICGLAWIFKDRRIWL